MGPIAAHHWFCLYHQNIWDVSLSLEPADLSDVTVSADGFTVALPRAKTRVVPQSQLPLTKYFSHSAFQPRDKSCTSSLSVAEYVWVLASERRHFQVWHILLMWDPSQLYFSLAIVSGSGCPSAVSRRAGNANCWAASLSVSCWTWVWTRNIPFFVSIHWDLKIVSAA